MGTRNIEANGLNMAVRTYGEIAEAVKSYFRKRAWRKKRAGNPYIAGDLKGGSYGINRLLLWFMTLSEADVLAIEQEGERLFEQLHELPPDYDGPLPFERRTESVFQGSIDTVQNARQNLGRPDIILDREDKPRRGKRPDGGHRSKRTG